MMNYKVGMLVVGTTAAALLSGIFVGTQMNAVHAAPQLKMTVLIKQELQSVEGKEVTVVKLDYPPGAASPAHRHPGEVFVYVLSGQLTSQLNDGPETAYGPGEIFYEAPMGLHAQSKNDGTEEHAIALAFIIGDKGKPQTLLERRHDH